MLGLVKADGTPTPLPWMAAVTEHPALGTTEIWEFRNFTEDAHPVHLHQVQFEVLDRRPFGGTGNPRSIGDPRPPESWERGLLAAVLSIDDAIASHSSAARLWSFSYQIDHRYEVTVPRPHRAKVRGVQQ